MPNPGRASILIPAFLAALVFFALFAGWAPAGETGRAPGAAIEAEGQTSAGVDAAELGRLVETAVNKQVRPLAREIRDLRDEIRLHDILGGIGYIMGLAGLVFYFLGVRKRRGGVAGSAD